jgi:hypothetical protein
MAAYSSYALEGHARFAPAVDERATVRRATVGTDAVPHHARIAGDTRVLRVAPATAEIDAREAPDADARERQGDHRDARQDAGRPGEAAYSGERGGRHATRITALRGSPPVSRHWADPVPFG